MKIQSDGKYVVVYSGTTLENFRRCAFTDRDRIFFDKLREPAHAHRRTYHDPTFDVAAAFAMDCANGRIPEHLPLVIEGRLERSISSEPLDEGELYPVYTTYVPTGKIDWHKLLTLPVTTDRRMFFVEVDARELLSQ